MWRVNKVTHNGVFVSFTPTGGNPISKFREVIGEDGTLEYYHWVNKKHEIVKGPDAGRIAEHPEDFELSKGSETGMFDIKKID